MLVHLGKIEFRKMLTRMPAANFFHRHEYACHFILFDTSRRRDIGNSPGVKVVVILYGETLFFLHPLSNNNSHVQVGGGGSYRPP